MLSSGCKMQNGKQIIDKILRVKNKSRTLRLLRNPHKSPSTCASASADAATALHRSAGDGEEVDPPSDRPNCRRLLFPHFLVRIHVREGIGSEGARRPDRRSPAQQCRGLGRHDNGRSGSEVSLRYFGHAGSGFEYNWPLFPSFEGTCDDWKQRSSCSRLSLVENDSL
ncbi:hypothetical protein ZIOFF_030108 [Zingiber officinale]|uniref:Uncharacterized protein n=1 Tax=Zingiber officinale TaxID=94328 RepID=A0A8J5GSM6_ZINOF|nr:hypothetical protein ZIOFF_030108 [Zingiber officinale]